MRPEQRVALRTQRLLLEPFARGHAQEVTPVIGHPLVADTTSNIPHPYTERDATGFAEAIESSAGGLHCWLLRTRGARAIVGGVGLHGFEGDAAEFGYWIGVDHWGNGYATEALVALLGHAFATLGLARLHACYFARNPASKRVMEKAGCTPREHGACPPFIEKNGVRERVGWMEMTRERWARQGTGGGA
ncbi:MAG: GNAT family N-acetyltransferase [Planctomycetota bacterium]